mmetsp:Transcript_13098/g.30499  ORF Transcript_13098/g.30499 Transcript_13098/m.30499 type:complete len:188 (+) Transcript_13098:21-584(+)
MAGLVTRCTAPPRFVRISSGLGCATWKRRRWSSDSNDDPFKILGVQESCSYVDVKKAFAKLALKHHPDMENGSMKQFTRIRHAFESIQEMEDGSAVQGDDNCRLWANANDIVHILREETGLDLNLDAATRREMTRVAETMSPGGLDRGAMWELASKIAREEKDNPSKDDAKELGAGESLSRPRRRRR